MSADDLLAVLDDLQGRLEGPAAYVYELSLRQVFISGGIALAIGLLGIIGGILMIRWAFRWYQAGESDSSFNNRDIPATFTVVGGVSTFLVGIAALAFSASHLLNPEYAALADLIAKVAP